VQILEHAPDTRSWSDETGHYIECYGIGTKFNEAKWGINKGTGHENAQKFPGHHFAIIPELIQKPLSEGGGGHYFGLDTREDLLKGYETHSHGVIQRLKGPYSYNDGTDDYFYNFVIKLRDSKAASALLEHGTKTWIPFAVSPHIWPLKGPDDDITDWEPIGAALVIKGAYGPQAVISKLCKGTSAQCEKSLGASTKCEDEKTADFITSYVSKSASTPYMPDSIPNVSTESGKVNSTPTVTEVKSTNPTVEPQKAITQSTRVVTPEEFEQVSKQMAELEKQNKILMEKDRRNTLTNLFAFVKDGKAKAELIEEYMKDKEANTDHLVSFYQKVLPHLKAETEQEPKEEEDNGKKETKAKSKSASLPKEPELPKEETESKAAAVPENKVKAIYDFIVSDGRVV